ncbi:MAG: nucleoside 2-deoxyribosyltransferase [Desulfobacterales bacterium]|nr:nucleoside 2-deoxyribosyltransferase [Desulfobacterales bacterium]
MNNKETVYIAGSSYSLSEKGGLNNIASSLKKEGYDIYLSYSDGLQAFIEKFKGSDGYEIMYKSLQKAIFCHEIFKLLEISDYLVFSMNGRVPDENGTFMTAIAFSAGKPLVIYKNDHRTVFHGNNNSMIDGCAWNFSNVNKLSDISFALQKAKKNNEKIGVEKISNDKLPPYIQNSLKIGKEIETYLADSNEINPDLFLLDINNIVQKNDIIPSDNNSNSWTTQNQKIFVYCSGGLFCPEELSDMNAISDILEQNGYGTYLPHRDGVEAFVINNTNSWFANSALTKPFLININKQVFALDVFQIVEKCDYFIMNMNGRVPDEGAVVEIAIALMHNKPIVIYKDDLRTLYFGINSPIIMAASYDFTITDKLENIPNELSRKAAIVSSMNKEPYYSMVQPNVKKIVKYGESIQKRIDFLKWAKPKNKMLNS